MDKLTQRIQQHSCQCQRPLQRTQLQMLGHVAMVTLQCDNGHKLLWPTSSYLGTKYLANSRMAHGYFISGILPNQYLRVAEAAGIGKLSDVYLSEFFENYKECVKTLADESCVDALYKEIVAFPEMDGINILTNARHGTRRNSKYTDVVCIGAESHKVLRIETITRADEPCAQKHELLGTKKIYDYLENQEGGSVSVRVLCHDRNMSVQSWVRGEKDTANTNDTWHATKNVAKEIKCVFSGPRHLEGKTWHPQLSEKAGSIKTHMYWAMKKTTTEQSADQLRKSVLNIINHYKNKHDDCHPTSRC